MRKNIKILHVSVQDPNHMTGGQGVSVLNTCKAQMALGYNVDYISLKLKGEAARQKYKFSEGALDVGRIAVSDSDYIETPYSGRESRQLGRREEFFHAVVEKIKKKYDPFHTYIHLHGFFFEPLIAGALPEFNVSSTYNLLISVRMEKTNEDNDIMYDFTRMMEICSFYSNKKIHAISPGVKEEILQVAKDIGKPFYKEGALRLAKKLNLSVPGLKEASIKNLHLKDRIYVIPHGASEEFFNERGAAPRPNRVVAWGRISPEKGVEYLLEAAGRLKKLDFLIWGTTGDTERKRELYKETLEEKANKLNNVKMDLRPGGVRGKEQIDMIDSGEIVVMPSLYEPFGLINVEALARGKPVITTATAGGKFIMGASSPKKLPYGYVIPTEKSKIALNIKKCLVDYFTMNVIEKKLMSASARRRADGFKWGNVVKEVVKMYKDGEPK